MMTSSDLFSLKTNKSSEISPKFPFSSFILYSFNSSFLSTIFLSASSSTNSVTTASGEEVNSEMEINLESKHRDGEIDNVNSKNNSEETDDKNNDRNDEEEIQRVDEMILENENVENPLGHVLIFSP
jgi:hypothetical protein